MKFSLTKKPKTPTVILGFPGVGLVGAIAIKFLIDHLDVEEIGNVESDHLTPLTAIHKSRIVNPITFFYNKKYNLLIVQTLTEVTGHEWELASTLSELAKTLKAKEMILLESMPPSQPQQEGEIPSLDGDLAVYYISNKKKLKLEEMKEGIVMGTTAAMLLKAKEIPFTCLFAEAHSQLPDSESAAKVIEALDNHLKINIDYKPLLEAAKKFEANLRHYMEEAKKAKAPKEMPKETRDVDYFG